MRIDWLTVAAQVVNFLILVFLLHRFLYTPVIEAMSRRERRIADRMAEAAEREKSATARKAEYEDRLAALEAERDARLAGVEREADDQRRELLDKAHQEIAAIEARWRADLGRERDEFLAELRRAVAGSAASIARKALSDLAGAELEEQIIARLMAQLDGLGASERSALVGSPGELTVATTFHVERTRQGALTRSLHEIFGRDVAVRYAKSDDLLCGIELRGAGRRVAWSIADYLEPIEREIGETLAAAAVQEGREP